jgi:type II secretory pathway pseudopilin PulG
MSLVEVVAATVLLTILAAIVFGAMSSIIQQQTRTQTRLRAMELANRLVLQYLDDANSMPPRTLPVAYGTQRFRWEMEELPTRMLPAIITADRPTSGLDPNRMTFVRITVWLSEESGGSFSPSERAPQATLTRLVDPAAFYRNPDTLAALLADEPRRNQMLARFMTTAQSSTGLVVRGAPATPRVATTDGRPTASSAPKPPRGEARRGKPPARGGGESKGGGGRSETGRGGGGK